MIESWIENPDEESMIIGRTQACEYIGQLEDEFKHLSRIYRDRGRQEAADTYMECAEMLESKIEDFANTK